MAGMWSGQFQNGVRKSFEVFSLSLLSLGIHYSNFIPSRVGLQRKHPACECFVTGLFYREGLLAPRPTLKLEDHPLSAVHDCLFNIFAATLHIGGRSSIRNLRTRHAMLPGTGLANTGTGGGGL